MAVELSCTAARVGVTGSVGNRLRGTVKNLGPGGVLINTEAGLTQGESLQILFVIDGQRIEATGRVAYVKPAPRDGINNGVEFTQIPDEHRDFLVAAILLQDNSSAHS